ncbi:MULTISPECIES: hypothetical protein [Burkholderia]|uniref:Lipoprotein n=1 Tax=Burkholderia sola TaxID=2843302 RepID=A0ABV2C1I7_9BURK|nr:hypothetical protein [Burkholderia sp. CpTa8-5]
MTRPCHGLRRAAQASGSSKVCSRGDEGDVRDVHRTTAIDAGQPHSRRRQYSGLRRSHDAAPDGARKSPRDEAWAMKHPTWAIGAALALGACAGMSQEAAFRSTETQLLAAREAAALHCSTAPGCDRAWQLARRYVDARSSTRITRFSEDRIETAQPHFAGEVYLWASRTASGDGGAVIRLKAMCKGMYGTDGGPGWQYDACVSKILEIERGFAAYERPPDTPALPVDPR